MTYQFWALIVGQYGVREYIFRVISLDLDIDRKNLLLFEVPNKNSHLCHIIVSLSQIRDINFFTWPSHKMVLYFFSFLFSHINPSVFVGALPRWSKDTILKNFLMQFFSWYRIKSITLFKSILLLNPRNIGNHIFNFGPYFHFFDGQHDLFFIFGVGCRHCVWVPKFKNSI